jgi:hypothetical protein
MTKLILTLTSLLSLTISSWARIGDTYQESVARYNDKGTWDKYGVHFYYNGWYIAEAFNVKGACDFVMYSHGDCSDLTEAEVNALLENNAPGRTWVNYERSCWEIDNLLFAKWYLTEWHSDSTGKTGTRQTLRIGTHNALVALGWMDGEQTTANDPNSI